MKFIVPLVAALTIAAGVSANALEEKSHGVTVTHPWTRATAPRQPAGAVYMSIHTENAEADRLIAVSSPAAERARLHTHIRDGDVMRMRPVEGIDIPADGKATLEPGGLHIMLIGLKAPLLEATVIPLTLTFEKAGEVEIEAVVEAPAARKASDAPAAHGGQRMTN